MSFEADSINYELDVVKLLKDMRDELKMIREILAEVSNFEITKDDIDD